MGITVVMHFLRYESVVMHWKLQMSTTDSPSSLTGWVWSEGTAQAVQSLSWIPGTNTVGFACWHQQACY